MILEFIFDKIQFMDLSYIEQYRLLYKNKPGYGKTSLSLFPIIAPLIRQMGCSEILDYGCGQSQLVNVLEKKLIELIAQKRCIFHQIPLKPLDQQKQREI